MGIMGGLGDTMSIHQKLDFLITGGFDSRYIHTEEVTKSSGSTVGSPSIVFDIPVVSGYKYLLCGIKAIPSTGDYDISTPENITFTETDTTVTLTFSKRGTNKSSYTTATMMFVYARILE